MGPRHRHGLPAPAGLYDPNDERDACGFGLIAQLDDQPSRSLVDTAISALSRMAHRGGVAADGLSGDGCGLLIRKPDAYLRALAHESGIALAPKTPFASGLVFLPADAALAARCCTALEEEVVRAGGRVAGWRVPPTDTAACGQLALSSLPGIRQLYVEAAPGTSEDDLALQLFLARRRSEQRVRDDAPDFYVVSLSPYSIGYKGMVLADKLSTFYPDLQRSDLSASAVVFHQRFSTNTLPRWPLAHPFRMLAHNGEINTIEGNRSWAQARSKVWKTPRYDLAEFDPIISMHGSDSQSLDNMLEILIAGGMDLLQALRILVPPATQSLEFKDADLAAFYEYHALNSEPWDGPAGIVAVDGRYAACMLDRNGLRPARWLLSSDRHFLVASEAGVWELPAERITRKGKLGPGEMMAIDLRRGDLLESDAIDRINRGRAPYKQWLQQGLTYLQTELIDPSLTDQPFDEATLKAYHKRFQLSLEEVESVLRPLAETEQEATGSMGDDTPMAVLSRQTRPLYDYFRQAFAQVTNPPIDPLREDCVMSQMTQLGRETNIFHAGPETVNHVLLNSPVLSQRKLRQLLTMQPFDTGHAYIDLSYAAATGLEAAIGAACAAAEAAARDGKVMLIISDRRPRDGDPVIHALLATGAVHHHLARVGLRCDVNLIIETGSVRDPHHVACLLGYGATAVYPYLAYQTLFDLGRRGILKVKAGEQAQIGRAYRKGIRKGLSKIISKMGISTVASYRAAQLFEIVGLDPAVVALCFAGTPSRIGGAGFERLHREACDFAELAADPLAGPDRGGLVKYVHGGEYHMYNPAVVISLQHATRTGDPEDWKSYTHAVHDRPPSALRDWLALKRAAVPTPMEDVAPASDLLRRFDTAAISLGALSPEAHEALAIAMNRLGGRSNSGEGGEDPLRYGTDKRSKIKQVASGRFGVTPAYLVNAEVLQIKVAQGAKPGEGGQLPGHKVDATIARLRYAKPGIGLISPPPHHDIYSIEDLAQLIFDLRQVNPQALISVKLVSHAGVGTIAAGVVKAGADLITVSGHDGGTGASPISSIRYAGVPWELGLAESHQALVANGLRERTVLQTDGGLKTGLDVIKAALLGADSFGFGTAPMIALGCKYLRICHLNNCATGVATQDENLRRHHFTGLPERVENFFVLLGEEVRGWLSVLGARSLDDIVGRTDLLEQLPVASREGVSIDLSRLLSPAYDEHNLSCAAQRLYESPDSLATQLDGLLEVPIRDKTGGDHRFLIHNTDRSIGARLSGTIARHHGNQGMADAPLNLHFRGSAGQSFGAFNAGGLRMNLEGEANDYVGKGMAGGQLVLRPPRGARFEARSTPILGNTCLYGATGGELFAAGRAGERFAVRNSGALAVVEGAGDHCCEYMTDGVVMVLGRTGLNFGAGFTGGLAYVLDLDRDFVDRYNHELIDIHRVSPEGFESHRQHVHALVQRHRELTGSIWAQQILDEFRDYIGKFWLVKPKAASIESLAESLRRAA